MENDLLYVLIHKKYRRLYCTFLFTLIRELITIAPAFTMGLWGLSDKEDKEIRHSFDARSHYIMALFYRVLII